MSDTLLIRTARAIYLADAALHGRKQASEYTYLTKGERHRYEELAAAALTVAYLEPVDIEAEAAV